MGNEYPPTNPNVTEDLHCSTGPENPDWATKSYYCVLLVLVEEWGTKTDSACSCTSADLALDDHCYFQSQMRLGDAFGELHLALPPYEWEM